jgi:hypothetical protein
MIDFYAFGKKNVEFINELNYVFDNDTYKGELPKNLENLIMSVYMQIFSYNFDDRRENELKFENISNITKKVWINNETNRTNTEVGKIYMQKKYIPEFQEKTKDEQTVYVLEEIRNSVVHGDFIINNDGTVTIFNHDDDGNETFKMTFEFECITDICEIISNNSTFKDVSPELLNVLSIIQNINKNMRDKKGFSSISQSFHDLKYPILFIIYLYCIFLLLP